MDRDMQIKLIETVEERRAEMTREWAQDAEFMAALRRYDHIFDEPPVRELKRAVG